MHAITVVNIVGSVDQARRAFLLRSLQPFFVALLCRLNNKSDNNNSKMVAWSVKHSKSQKLLL